MRSIRKFAYALALTLSALTLNPVLASAQEAHGSFTLTHEVQWGSVNVPAGEYQFSIESRGPSKLLVVRHTSGKGAGFLMAVHETETIGHSEVSRLQLVSQSGRSYVSTMELPAWGVTLHFAVPSEGGEKQVAAAQSGAAASSAR